MYKKDTVVNRTLASSHGGSLESMLTLSEITVTQIFPSWKKIIFSLLNINIFYYFLEIILNIF